MTRNEVSPKQITEVKVNNPQSVLSGANTYSTLFLIPAFDVHLDKYLYGMFVNSYTNDMELNHVYSKPLFVLVSVDNPRDYLYLKTDMILRENKTHVYNYVVGRWQGSYLIMYVFECPEEFSADYEAFTLGKYSTFSERYKQRFTKMVPNLNGEVIESPIYGVLYKTNIMKSKIEKIIGQRLEKSQELFSVPIPEYETFRYITKTTTNESKQVQAAKG